MLFPVLSGPDGSFQSRIEVADHTAVLVGHVLHLRGKKTSQPHVGYDADGFATNYLLWNGEIFDGIPIGITENDTEVLMCEICRLHTDPLNIPTEPLPFTSLTLPRLFETGSQSECSVSSIYEKSPTIPKSVSDKILELFSKIRGPWAFIYVDVQQKKLWFGRDFFGRRSLIWHLPATEKDSFILSSTAYSFSTGNGTGDIATDSKTGDGGSSSTTSCGSGSSCRDSDTTRDATVACSSRINGATNSSESPSHYSEYWQEVPATGIFCVDLHLTDSSNSFFSLTHFPWKQESHSCLVAGFAHIPSPIIPLNKNIPTPEQLETFGQVVLPPPITTSAHVTGPSLNYTSTSTPELVSAYPGLTPNDDYTYVQAVRRFFDVLEEAVRRRVNFRRFLAESTEQGSRPAVAILFSV